MTDRIADVSDRASVEEERHKMESIRAASLVEKPPKDWDRETCVLCGNDLPEVRIKALRFRCVPCQTKHEKKLKGY